MRDLRKQALGLESGKTVSRKARSRQATPNTSPGHSTSGSRGNSRVPSRNASDDEGDFSDATQWSNNSITIDEVLTSDLEQDASEAWVDDLGDRVSEICDRKRSSIQGREEALDEVLQVWHPWDGAFWPEMTFQLFGPILVEQNLRTHF